MASDAADAVAEINLGTRGNYLRSCVLLLLSEGPAHGYELLSRLSERGFGHADAGGLYRALRVMEEDGLLASSWDHGESGPARRVYFVTDEGRAWLDESAHAVRDMRTRLTRFLRHYRDLESQSEITAEAS